MNLLFLNPYDGGSHRAFAEGWRACSTHELTVLGLPARHWKWRMRHSALTLAERARELDVDFDAVVTTDMLDLPAWRGFAPAAVRDLPTVVYFHENQLTYPDAHRRERDFHFGFTNLLSAAAATQVWFNSQFHRGELLAAWRQLLERMPDFRSLELIDRIEAASEVCYPGISSTDYRSRDTGAPPHILWAARWEADKAPATFFAALDRLVDDGVDFRVSVLGRAGDHEPPLFDEARQRLGARVVGWGWLPRADYEATLATADIVVSTAWHEFFGIAIAEAVGAGAYPLVPRRLAYPELLAGFEDALYDEGQLVDRLADLCRRCAANELWAGEPERGRALMARYEWKRIGRELDDRIARLSA